jgi:hypothetical protein
MARPINRELADPMDRESSRTRRKDSLDDDLSEMRRDSIAEYQMRLKNPRNDVWGKTLEEDTPENLRKIFIDPFERESSRRRSTTAPRTYKVGNDVVSFDPNTGESKMVFKAPVKPEKDYRDPIRFRAAANRLLSARKAMGGYVAPSKAAALDAELTAAQAEFDVLNKDEDQASTQPAPAAAVPAAAALESPIRKPLENYGFISNTDDSEGIPLGENRFQTKISKNGRLPKSLAVDLLNRYKGDKEMARKEAEKMGYTTEFIE